MDCTSQVDPVDIVRRASDVLLKIEGVLSVAWATKTTSGRDTGYPALTVTVIEKKPAADLAAGQLIPAEIDGLRTDVVEANPAYLLQDDPNEDRDFRTGFEPDEQQLRPIVGGLRIRGESSRDFERRPSFGTLGCFAIPNEDPTKTVLLTNHHVLADPFDKLNGPSCTGCTKGDGVGNPDVGSQIATVLRGFDNAKMDAAIAILDKDVQFARDIFNDELPSRREVIRGTRPLTTADENTLVVHKRGHRTKLTKAVIGNIDEGVTIGTRPRKEHQIRIDLPEKVSSATATFPAKKRVVAPGVDFVAEGVVVDDVLWIDGVTNRGRFRITKVGPPLAPNELEVDVDDDDWAISPGPFVGSLFVTGPNFALKGDSGSVLLDPDGNVVGLIWAARAMRRGNVWATPIGVIETDLKIKIATATAINDVQTARSLDLGPRRGEVVAPDQAQPAAAALGAADPLTLRARVEQDLLPLPGGRQIYDLYFRHHQEVRALIDTNRQVALVWHRQSGPGIIQMVLDAVRSRTTLIPTSIRGKSWTDRVGAILEIFDRFGSSRLREDIARFGPNVAALGGMTYPRFLETLKA